MAKKKATEKESKPVELVITSKVMKVNAKQLQEELEKEKGVSVKAIEKARTETPRTKHGDELPPVCKPTEVKLVCDKKPTKTKEAKLQKIVDSHKPKLARSPEDMLAEAQRLLKQLDSLRD